MSQMWSGLLLALGAAIPFAVVLGVLWFGVRAIRGRRPEQVEDDPVVEEIDEEDE